MLLQYPAAAPLASFHSNSTTITLAGARTEGKRAIWVSLSVEQRLTVRRACSVSLCLNPAGLWLCSLPRPSQLPGLIDGICGQMHLPDSNKDGALGKSKAIIDGQQCTNQTISKLIPQSLTVLAFLLVCIYTANS